MISDIQNFVLNHIWTNNIHFKLPEGHLKNIIALIEKSMIGMIAKEQIINLKMQLRFLCFILMENYRRFLCLE